MQVYFTWIARDDRIYRLTGVTASRISRRFEGTLGNVARSFRPLTPEQRASIHETRLHVVSALPEETLQALSERTENQWDLQQTAVVNDLFTDRSLKAGHLVKVAVSRPPFTTTPFGVDVSCEAPITLGLSRSTRSMT